MARTGLTSLLLGALLLCLAPAVPADDTRAQLRELRGKIETLQKQLERKRGKRSETVNALRDTEKRIGALLKQIREAEAALDRQNEQLAEMQKRRDSLQQQRRQQQELMEHHVLQAYQMGREKKLKVLLNQESPDRLNRALTYFDYFNRARAEQVEKYLETIEELDSLTPAIEAKRQELQQSRDQLAQRRDALKAERAEREHAVARLDAAISQGSHQLEEYQLEQKELEQVLTKLREEITHLAPPGDNRPFKAMRGEMPWPIHGKHANRFGTRRGGSSLTWQGVQINADAGTKVKAIHSGRIVFADWLRGAGLLIIIDHGDGYMSLYGHNQSLLRDTGDWVGAGEVIATVGDTGGRQEAGLYFEIRHNGRPTNPARWCRG